MQYFCGDIDERPKNKAHNRNETIKVQLNRKPTNQPEVSLQET